jgi:pimeloyl-ACP methyl ester carboxylesterase
MTVTHQSPLLDPRSRPPRRRRWPRRVAIGIATTVSALLAALLDRASLVGHSFGGAWSLYFTEQHPERVERLVLLDAPALDAERAPQTRVFRIPVIEEAVAGLMGRGDFADSLCSAFHHQDRVKDEVIDETWVWFSRPETARRSGDWSAASTWPAPTPDSARRSPTP